jgi:hypothetical protein
MLRQGDLTQARRLAEESLVLNRRIGETFCWRTAWMSWAG